MAKAIDKDYLKTNLNNFYKEKVKPKVDNEVNEIESKISKIENKKYAASDISFDPDSYGYLPSEVINTQMAIDENSLSIYYTKNAIKTKDFVTTTVSNQQVAFFPYDTHVYKVLVTYMSALTILRIWVFKDIAYVEKTTEIGQKDLITTGKDDLERIVITAPIIGTQIRIIDETIYDI